jgi:hypothetical protein
VTPSGQYVSRAKEEEREREREKEIDRDAEEEKLRSNARGNKRVKREGTLL